MGFDEPGELELRFDAAEDAAAVLDRTGLRGFAPGSSLTAGERTLSSSPVSCPLVSLWAAELIWLAAEVRRPGIGLAAGFGASDVRFPILDNLDGLGATGGLDARAVGAAGGPIEVRFVARLGLEVIVIEDGRVFEGVPVRGVDAAEVAPDISCFVGDLVGDLIHVNTLQGFISVLITYPQNT